MTKIAPITKNAQIIAQKAEQKTIEFFRPDALIPAPKIQQLSTNVTSTSQTPKFVSEWSLPAVGSKLNIKA